MVEIQLSEELLDMYDGIVKMEVLDSKSLDSIQFNVLLFCLEDLMLNKDNLTPKGESNLKDVVADIKNFLTMYPGDIEIRKKIKEILDKY